jgi:hypothetical protein
MRLEQRGEIAFAEAFVPLALDEFEEHRADHRFGEDLEQQPRIALLGRAIQQDAAPLQLATGSPWPGRRSSSIS